MHCHMIQRVIAEDGMVPESQSREGDEEREGEATGDLDGSSSAITREKMPHHFKRVGRYVAGKNERDSLPH